MMAVSMKSASDARALFHFVSICDKNWALPIPIPRGAGGQPKKGLVMVICVTKGGEGGVETSGNERYQTESKLGLH